MFSRIFVEESLVNHPQVELITQRFSNVPVTELESIDDVFGRVKKPYLKKREDLQLFLGEKKGTLLKEAPDAYGLAGEPHYYFIHAYNCIYECEYCYLQGYFNSPDIVLFLNHNDIGVEIEATIQKHKQPQKRVWFHAGEFSDSLALTHLTGELPFYFELFAKHPQAMLELRTKSANIKELTKLSPLKNVITSFSLSPESRIKKTDLKTPGLSHRLKVMAELQERGFPVAIHLDPIIHEENFEATYRELFEALKNNLDLSKVEYVSMGVVRFTSNVFHQVKKNYPNSELLAAEFQSSFDGKVRYPRPFRLWLLGKIKDLGISAGLKEEQIYLCME
jgi:spore photoproduct lyase